MDTEAFRVLRVLAAEARRYDEGRREWESELTAERDRPKWDRDDQYVQACIQNRTEFAVKATSLRAAIRLAINTLRIAS